MRAFLVLACAVCLVVARPQVGYNYEPNQGFQPQQQQQQQQFFSAPLIPQPQPLPAAPEQLQQYQPEQQYQPAPQYQPEQHYQSEQHFQPAQQYQPAPLSAVPSPYEHQAAYAAQHQYSPLPTSQSFLTSAHGSYAPAHPFAQSAYTAQSAQTPTVTEQTFEQPAYVQHAAPLAQQAFAQPAYVQQTAPVAQQAFAQPAYVQQATPIAHQAFAQPAYVQQPAPIAQQAFAQQSAYIQHTQQATPIEYPTAPIFSTTFNGLTGFNAQPVQAAISSFASLPQAPLSTVATPLANEYAAQQQFASHLTHQVSHDDASATAFATPAQQTQQFTQSEAFVPSLAAQQETFATSPAPQTETLGPSPADIAIPEPTQQKTDDDDSIAINVTPSSALSVEAPAQIQSVDTAPETETTLTVTPSPVPTLIQPEPQQLPDTQPRYQDLPQPAPIQQTTIHKHIYVHVPPPDLDEPEPVQLPPQPVSRQHKHYKIIFIKAPSLSQAKYIAPQLPQNEEKTLVYVLVKKPDVAQEILQPIEQPEIKREKPEVYFIKYKAHKGAAPPAPGNSITEIEPRAKPPQFPALENSDALLDIDSKPEPPQADTLISAKTSITVESDDASPSLALSKKYIPARK